MKMTAVGPNKEQQPVFIQGLMRTEHLSVEELTSLLEGVLDYDITFLDTSDIYTDGYCESLLGKAFAANGELRNKFTLQSKCGIRRSPKGFTFYDFSTDYILQAAEASLTRLQTDHLDYYLLHRPDALFEPEEVAAAFDKLQQSGKVLRFGVSNMNTAQLSYLRQYVRQPIEVNQLQISVAHTLLIDSAIMTNRFETNSLDHNQGILDYCRSIDCTVQAWSPFRAAKAEGSTESVADRIQTWPYLGDSQFPALNAKLEEFSERFGVSPGAVTIAWLLRHPANMQIVLGSTKLERIRDALDGMSVSLSREDWYELYIAGGNIVP